MFVAADPTHPTPFGPTSATWVATPVALDAMLDALWQAPDIAIDLERSSCRSYAVFVCLVQIRTRPQDWIMVTPALRAGLAMGGLSEAFAVPTIAFHGAESHVVGLW
ncbi:hypothetical protein FB451DRAFT_1411022 [Mycena latifolia]|nr:hypothetical protein FB451DRAFT_1411022 [Mycena latifolia]